MRSSVGSVKHDVGKRRDFVAHLAVTFTILPLPLVTLGEFGWKSNSIKTPKYRI